MAPADGVLIVGPSWIGDMVMAQSLCRVLRQRAPQQRIDMLAPGWSLPVIERMGEVTTGLESPFGHGVFDLAGRRRLGRQLRERGYRRAIVIPRSFKAALAPYFASIPQRTGYRGEWRFGLLNDVRRLDPERLPRTVDRYVALGLDAGEPLPDRLPSPRLRIDAANRSAALERLGLDIPSALVGMMPGAEYGPAKQWPVSHFGALAAELNRAGRPVWIFGSEKDRGAGDEIAAIAGSGTVNLCGRTSLADAIDLISLSRDVVTNDSGLMHVAAATGVRVIAIYGSSSPAYTPPLTDTAEILWLDLDCSPCFARTCRYGHYRCLHDISVARVASLLD